MEEFKVGDLAFLDAGSVRYRIRHIQSEETGFLFCDLAPVPSLLQKGVVQYVHVSYPVSKLARRFALTAQDFLDAELAVSYAINHADPFIAFLASSHADEYFGSILEGYRKSVMVGAESYYGADISVVCYDPSFIGKFSRANDMPCTIHRGEVVSLWGLNVFNVKQDSSILFEFLPTDSILNMVPGVQS